MATTHRHGFTWVNSLSHATLVIAILIYLVGAAALVPGTILSLMLLVYHRLRDGIWCACTLTDLLLGRHANESASWFMHTALLITMPSVGGTLTVAGIAILFSRGLGRS